MKAVWHIVCFVLFVIVADSTFAALITPTTIAFTGTAGEFYPNETNLINGSGLSSTPTELNYNSITHANADTNNSWVTIDPAPTGGDYYAQSTATVIFQMGFDTQYSFTDFIFWGYSPGGNNGNESRAFTLDFSTDNGVTFPTSVLVSNPLSTYAGNGRTTFSLGSSINANVVRLTVTDNQFGGTAAGGDRVGLGEIRFLGTAVPEPGSMALILLAISGAYGLLRRR